MAGSVTMTPDSNGQITVNCNGTDIVITIAPAGGGQVTKGPDDDDDPFSWTDRNLQYLGKLPDGRFSVRTVAGLGAAGELARLHRHEPQADLHVVRVRAGRSVNLHELDELNRLAGDETRFIILPHDD
jgi:hypothetical protein